jgi:hypothetical protein
MILVRKYDGIGAHGVRVSDHDIVGPEDDLGFRPDTFVAGFIGSFDPASESDEDEAAQE